MALGETVHAIAFLPQNIILNIPRILRRLNKYFPYSWKYLSIFYMFAPTKYKKAPGDSQRTENSGKLSMVCSGSPEPKSQHY